jgi:hypothetical protein
VLNIVQTITDIADSQNGKNVYSTGMYRNDAQCRYECWAYNGEKRILLSACTYELPNLLRREWQKEIWRNFFALV